MTGAGFGFSGEDVCEIPPNARRLVIPRRGGDGIPSVDAADGAAFGYHVGWLAEHAGVVAGILDAGESDPELVREFRAAGGGGGGRDGGGRGSDGGGRGSDGGAEGGAFDLSAATPLAAAVGAALAVSPNTPEHEDPARLVDAWFTARGIAFATAAAVELFGITVTGVLAGPQPVPPHVRRHTVRSSLDTFAGHRFAIARRLRGLLAVASDVQYGKAREVLTEYRASLSVQDVATVQQRALASFLMPEHTEWVDADLASFPVNRHDQLLHWLQISSLTTEEHAAAFQAEYVSWWWMFRQPDALWTAVDAVGADILPILVVWLGHVADPEAVEFMLGIVGCLSGDEAFQFLIDNIDRKHFSAAAVAAAKRFPRRALRLLAEAASRGGSSATTPRGMAVAHVLRFRVLADNELTRSELPGLTPGARAAVERVLAANIRVPEADAESLPALFTSPPWVSGLKARKPVVLKDLTAPAEVEMAWRDGEREQWAAQEVGVIDSWRLDSWETIAQKIAEAGSANWYADGRFAVEAPEELVRSVLPVWQPDTWRADEWIRQLVVRFGAEALPVALHVARRQPAAMAPLLGPFAAPEAAVLAADWLVRLKSARPLAMAWLTRHPGAAARALIPVALGKAGKARSGAEQTLRVLAGAGFEAEIAAAARGYGEAAAEAITGLVADDGTLNLPKVMPKLPAWADPQMLPQILLRDGQSALPEEAVGHLLVMLAVSTQVEPYVGLLAAKEICDPSSLADFAWLLFQSWRAADYPAKETWAFEALRWFGDDETVRRLAPLIRLWPGENGHHRAVAGLEILAGIGGDAALMQLYGISQKVKFKGLKEQAAQRIGEIAEELGLSSEQLGDRLVPDLGLGADGSMVLDYGNRRFTVGFDEQLKPYVVDGDGRRLKALPKPGAKDDPVLAPAAYQAFGALKKDVRTLAADQIARFEAAMVTQRRWTPEEFTEYFVAHPLLRHLVRRVVWGVYEDERFVAGFRVAEDGTFADIADDVYPLPDKALIGIAHPLHLGSTLAAWSDVFADYEILQPFAQLGREVHTLSEEEKSSTDLKRFHAIDIPVGRILGLERRGWHRGSPQDAGVQRWIYRALPGGGAITVDLDPGIVVGYVDELGETQRFTAVFLEQRSDLTFSGLDEVTVSEVLRDLVEVTAQ